jgi:hypothetical protein
MAATTISRYSDPLWQTNPGNPQLYAPVKANIQHGKVRCENFSITFASEVSGTSMALCILPRGSRIISGVLAATATLANSATLAVGLAAKDKSGLIHLLTDGGLLTTGVAVAADTSDGTALLKAAAAQGTAQVPFAITMALGYLYETKKEVYVTITTGTGTVATEVLFGHVLYVVE